MNLWQIVKRWLDPAAGTPEELFSLGDRGEKPDAEERGARLLADAQIRAEGVLTHIDSLLEAQPQGKEALDKAGDLSDKLDENVARLKKLFRMPENKDLIIREILVATQPPTRAVACFMEGLSDKMVINGHILEPLMLVSHLDHHIDGEGESGKTEFSLQTVLQRLLPGHQTAEKPDMAAISESLLAGDTVLFFEGARAAISVETKAPPGRSVSDAKQEQVVQGAKDAFVEAWRVNVALVRRRLKDPRVVTEILTVGEVSRNYVGMMYIDGIVTPKLVAEVKRRVEAISVDVMNSSGVLEQFIEDSPRSLFPGALTTERPDRTAAYLAEGNVALLVDNTPYALIAPITFWSLLQTPEDYYLRWPFGAFIRYLRLFALLVATITPALYLSVVNYHHEMIPTELMLFIAASRESVPLPAIAELLVMDLVFEMIRESGVRIPNVIGPTIGLVSSLVLGQAAVEAKLISPLVIMIVAVTGLASFAIPNYLTSFAIRSLRFLLLFCAMFMGFYGVAIGVFVIVIYLSGMRSFGVPYLSPVAPLRPLTADALTRGPIYRMESRPRYTRPLNEDRQKEIIRTWDPAAPDPDKGSDGQDEGGSA
ncbi:MAG TPA: spore germination protein [Symbiobacteriaceae bacterium]|nr:spore germination protein [Symbiobacteriaceae bacterium]